MALQVQEMPPASAAQSHFRPLGSLETRLMNAVWDAPARLTVQGVCDALGDGHNYKTVMTVLNRLVAKGLLRRALQGKAFRYSPGLSRDAYLRGLADDFIRQYVETYGPAAATHVAEAAACFGAPVARTETAPVEDTPMVDMIERRVTPEQTTVETPIVQAPSTAVVAPATAAQPPASTPVEPAHERHGLFGALRGIFGGRQAPARP